MGYGSINHPVDRDPVCGYTGIIGDTCPFCGRKEGDIKFERIRRITGYLVGTIERFNDAKRLRERSSKAFWSIIVNRLILEVVKALKDTVRIAGIIDESIVDGPGDQNGDICPGLSP